MPKKKWRMYGRKILNKKHAVPFVALYQECAHCLRGTCAKRRVNEKDGTVVTIAKRKMNCPCESMASPPFSPRDPPIANADETSANKNARMKRPVFKAYLWKDCTPSCLAKHASTSSPALQHQRFLTTDAIGMDVSDAEISCVHQNDTLCKQNDTLHEIILNALFWLHAAE